MLRIDINIYSFQRKDERITSLETENAMLYLKLAQLRSEVSSTREAASSSNALLESGDQFKANVKQKALQFCQEAQVG